MVKKTHRILILLFFSFSVLGCSSLTYLKDNPVFIDVATRQSVARYIDAGETEADKNKRGREVIETVGKVLDDLDGFPLATVDELFAVVNSKIQWADLSLSDRLLVQDILALLSANLESKKREGLIGPEALIQIRKLLNTVVLTARLMV